MDITQAVRTTQILLDEGWQFNDNGCPTISSVYNAYLGEEKRFVTLEAFEEWFVQQRNRLDV